LIILLPDSCDASTDCELEDITLLLTSVAIPSSTMREDERTVDGVLLLFFEVEDEWVKKLDSLAIGDLPMVLFALEEDVDRLFLLFFESEM
jgi:hypothetical protein